MVVYHPSARPYPKQERNASEEAVSTVAWPNNPVELTAHSAGFLAVHHVFSSRPPLTGGVMLAMK
jgi:hypothetical protein